MKKFLVYLFLLIFSYESETLAYSDSLTVIKDTTLLSRSAKVSLLTLSSGSELYSTFGHNAIWIEDTANGIDYIYNYGTFDFNDPDFYMKFTRGKLLYFLSKDDGIDFQKYVCVSENRTLTEQVLRLDSIQQQKIYDFLRQNIKGDNKYYKYDFFYDNCSTRLRNVLTNATDSTIQWGLEKDINASFRQLIDKYLRDFQYQDLGMDSGMGYPADVKASPWQYLFLPENLMNAVDKSTLNSVPLVKEKRILHQARSVYMKSSMLESPWIPAYLFLILSVLISFVFYRKKLLGDCFDGFWIVLTILFGFVFLFLWFFTDHSVTKWNMNLLWASPFGVLLFFVRHKIMRLYTWYYLLLLILLIISIRFLPQEINLYWGPLWIGIAIRCFVRLRNSSFSYFNKRATA